MPIIHHLIQNSKSVETGTAFLKRVQKSGQNLLYISSLRLNKSSEVTKYIRENFLVLVMFRKYMVLCNP